MKRIGARDSARAAACHDRVRTDNRYTWDHERSGHRRSFAYKGNPPDLVRYRPRRPSLGTSKDVDVAHPVTDSNRRPLGPPSAPTPLCLGFPQCVVYSNWQMCAYLGGAANAPRGAEEAMVRTARQFARPVALVVLILFVAGPAWVWAEPRRDPGTAGAVVPRPSEAAPSASAAASRYQAALAAIPADLTPASGAWPTGRSPRWFEADASPASGGWWSRRTTAQKTWFIVGLVVGGYGIYAVASNSSKSHSSGGGGGGGY